MTATRVVIPSIAHKGPNDTDAGMFRRAAENLELGYELGGGNLKRAVADLLTSAAVALEGTAPLPQRMRDAAETIEELNALCGMGINCAVNPKYLRAEADRMEMTG